jgi:hypothetical protein
MTSLNVVQLSSGASGVDLEALKQHCTKKPGRC